MKIVTLDKEIFEKAYELCGQKLDRAEVAAVLCGHDDVKKQIVILQLEEIEEVEHANLLVSNLTGQDGPVREATALKLRELLLEKQNIILDKIEFYQDYINAVCDVNPNICRMVIEFLPILQNQQELQRLLLKKIENVFYRIDNPDKDQKNFLTVRLFNLYWCLEAVGNLLYVWEDFINYPVLLNILERSIEFNDYTIDEKTARIVTDKACRGKFEVVENRLKTSSNFYVKRYFE